MIKKPFEKQIDDQLKRLKEQANSLNIQMQFKFLGDSIAFKDGKVLMSVPRLNYFKLAQKVKEISDLMDAIEMDDTMKRFKK